jgi:hypothetical protein
MALSEKLIADRCSLFAGHAYISCMAFCLLNRLYGSWMVKKFSKKMIIFN